MVSIKHSGSPLSSPGTGPWMPHCTLVWPELTLSLFGNGGTPEVRDRDYQQIRRYGIFSHTPNHIVGQQSITALLTSNCDLSCFCGSPSITTVSLGVTKWFSWTCLWPEPDCRAACSFLLCRAVIKCLLCLKPHAMP